jgi:DNA-binding LytR/AlgR family response regulator
MINCISIDDEIAGLQLINGYIKKTASHKLEASFSSPSEGLNYVKNHHVDAIYMDIEMPDLSGIEFIGLIDEHFGISKGPKVVFTTAHRSYAVDSFRFDRVLGFLKKPYTYHNFLVYAQKLERHFNLSLGSDKSNDEDDVIVLTRWKEKIHIPVKDIIYITSSGNSVIVSLIDDVDERFYMPFYAIEDKLPEDKFIRIHKSYIVATNRIQSISGSKLKLKDLRISFPIGVTYQEKIHAIKKY